MRIFERFRKDTTGSTAIEYGLICALIFLVAVSAMQVFGVKVTSLFTFIGSEMTKT